jgi:hypothetical protein
MYPKYCNFWIHRILGFEGQVSRHEAGTWAAE